MCPATGLKRRLRAYRLAARSTEEVVGCEHGVMCAVVQKRAAFNPAHNPRWSETHRVKAVPSLDGGRSVRVGRGAWTRRGL